TPTMETHIGGPTETVVESIAVRSLSHAGLQPLGYEPLERPFSLMVNVAAGCCNCCCNASRTRAEFTKIPFDLSSESGDPCGIRTRDLHLERVASWAARRTGQQAAAPGGKESAQEYTRSILRIR